MSENKLKDSLNLPKTDFPMKANLPQREPEILKKWYDTDIYGLIRKKRKGSPRYILHDGPPYANGSIHIGHVLNKILKDFVIKSKTMSGYESPYLPGWDCHGLPIELKAEKELGTALKEKSIKDFLTACRGFADKYVDIQREEFKRLGVLGEWDNPYKTMNAEYEANIVREVSKLYEKGYIYRGKKPVLWCIDCVTALATAEVEYKDHSSPSVYIKFKINEDLSDIIPELKGKKTNIIIWTTTPWTIPANLAVTVHPEYEYMAMESGNEVYIVAEYLAPGVMEACGLKDSKVIAKFKGGILDKRKARHPFYDRDSLIIIGDHVTLDAGTGCVHTAPGHGMEDYIVALKYGLDIYNPVDDNGNFVKELEFFGGMNVFKANPVITDHMRKNGSLLGEESILHSYPHCWRCDNPVIFRATEQWFINIEHDDLRQKALKKIETTKWIPEWGEERIYNMVKLRPDWCITRQRKWGTPFTIFHCNDCGDVIASPEIFEHVAKIFEKEHLDAWHLKTAKELAPAGMKCPKCGSENFRKETNIIDVWFDSGVSSRVVLGKREDLPWPSDLYLEGSDQHRGWFHSALLTSVAVTGEAPYKEVLTHGFTIDSEGHPLSKKKGNYEPLPELLKKYGAEILRLWVAMVDYREDVRFSDQILAGAVEAYKKIRNTIRFGLGNLYDFDPDKDAVPFDDMEPFDRYGLALLDEMIGKAREAYGKFEFTEVFHAMESFCIVDLSAFLYDVLKDRLYIYHPRDKQRLSAQTAIFTITRNLIELLAPIMSFTSEEAWEYLPNFKGKETSPLLMLFPEAGKYSITKEEKENWDFVIRLREDGLKALERAREKKIIGHSLTAKIILSVGEKHAPLVRKNLDLIGEILIVSQVELSKSSGDLPYKGERVPEISMDVTAATGAKCERCWHFSEHTGEFPEFPTVCERCAAVLKRF
jgi:isoleucyl-tRNA synthetase